MLFEIILVYILKIEDFREVVFVIIIGNKSVSREFLLKF